CCPLRRGGCPLSAVAAQAAILATASCSLTAVAAEAAILATRSSCADLAVVAFGPDGARLASCGDKTTQALDITGGSLYRSETVACRLSWGDWLNHFSRYPVRRAMWMASGCL